MGQHYLLYTIIFFSFFHRLFISFSQTHTHTHRYLYNEKEKKEELTKLIFVWNSGTNMSAGAYLWVCLVRETKRDIYLINVNILESYEGHQKPRMVWSWNEWGIYFECTDLFSFSPDCSTDIACQWSAILQASPLVLNRSNRY